MKITSKGQVTIPLKVREKLGVGYNSEIDFIEKQGKVYIIKSTVKTTNKNRFQTLKGTASIKMTTDEILSLTREEE